MTFPEYVEDKKIKTGGFTKKFDRGLLDLYIRMLRVYRDFGGKKYKIYGAGSSDWAQHTAQGLRKKGKAARVVPFGDSNYFFRAVYVRE